MILRRYGGPWQEFRAYLATVLFGWAQSVHFAATMDLAKMLAALEAEARADKIPLLTLEQRAEMDARYGLATKIARRDGTHE